MSEHRIGIVEQETEFFAEGYDIAGEDLAIDFGEGVSPKFIIVLVGFEQWQKSILGSEFETDEVLRIEGSGVIMRRHIG